MDELKENNLLQLLLHAPDAIIVIDEAGKITFWNLKAEAIFGWTSVEALGHSLTETIIPPQYREYHEAGMQRFLTTGEIRVLNRTIEVTALNKNGKEFFVSLTISAINRENSFAFIAFIRDITEKKENELALELKSKELEQSNRELEHFAHVASHDMKEPVRKISVFSDIIKTRFSDLLPAAGQEYLQKIVNSASRLNEMVEGVLKYSVVQSNQDQYELIDLTQILKDIESDFELLISDKKATIRYSDLPKFEGIPFLIYQLFYNLVHNSLKFAREGIAPVIEIGGKLTTETSNAEILSGPDNCFVALFVKDNGIGFDQDEADNIFFPFTRLNSNTLYKGTGLGLALGKRIVDRHLGSISAESRKGEGSTFWIMLPCRHHPLTS